MARGACVRFATANASIGKRMPTKTSSSSRISRAAATTIISPLVTSRAFVAVLGWIGIEDDS